MESLEIATINSPIGTIEISGSEKGIRSILWVDDCKPSNQIPACLQQCAAQLKEYFAGGRHDFDIEIDPQGTAFQLRVWKALKEIPFGATITYLELACRVGGETFTRAVANANGKNKINIIVPCHRVIGSNGKLTGYAGGLWRKEFLLKLEMGNLLPGLFGGLRQPID